MENFRAKRLSLTQANIYGNDDRPLSFIFWPVAKIWSCENAAIGDPYHQDKSLGVYPSLIINGIKLTARRKLLTNKFFGNEYEFSLWDEKGKCAISALRPGRIWKKTKIRHNDQIYFLLRKNLFRFHFILKGPDSEISRFTDATSFFTFSSYREFSISLEDHIDPMVLTFSFFLAHNEFF